MPSIINERKGRGTTKSSLKLITELSVICRAM